VKRKKNSVVIEAVQGQKIRKGKCPIAFKAVMSADLGVGREVEKATTFSIRSIKLLWDEIGDLWSVIPVSVLDEAWAVDKESFEPHGEFLGTMTLTCQGGINMPAMPARWKIEQDYAKKGATAIEEAWTEAMANYELRKKQWQDYQQILMVLSECAQRELSIPAEVSWRSEPAPGELPFPTTGDVTVEPETEADNGEHRTVVHLSIVNTKTGETIDVAEGSMPSDDSMPGDEVFDVHVEVTPSDDPKPEE